MTLKAAERKLPEAIRLLEDLTAVDTGTGQTEGIRQASTLLESHLSGLGMNITAVASERYGRHLIARRPGEGRPILLLAHLDTVHPPGTARRPLQDDDKLSGPGVADCKGGVVLGVMACMLWATAGWPSAPITLLLNADEEVGSLDSRPLIEKEAAGSRAALVLEPAPNFNSVICARKGIGRYLLRVFGRSAHAGADHQVGINALVELAAKILAFEDLNTAEGITVTIGAANGGTRPNVIPDYAQAEIDLRITAPDQIDRAERAIRGAAAVSRIPGARYALEGGITRPPMPESPENRRLLSLARETASSLGMEMTGTASGGGSDGNFCAALGVPVLDGLGPAGGGAHTAEEFIYCSSLVPRAALLADLCSALAKAWP